MRMLGEKGGALSPEGLIAAVWKKLKQLHKELGTTLMLDYLGRRTLAAVGIGLQRYHLVLQPVATKAWVPERHRASFDIREVDQTSYRVEWFPRPAEVVQARFNQGAHCWVAFKDEKPVGCQWLLPGPYLEDEVRCRFVPVPQGSLVWDFDVYVTPELRLGRLFLLLWDTTNRWMRQRGIDCSASRIDTLNLQSIRSHQRMGARIIGNAWFVNLAGLQLARWPNGWSVSKRSVPDIAVGDDACGHAAVGNGRARV